MTPSAEMVRAAIVAACVETGERPEDCINRVMGLRSRHYAMHALVHVCGRALKGSVIAESVGCPGEGRHFYRNSVNQTVAIIDGKRRARWWSEAAYGRTIAAVELLGRPVVETPAPAKRSPSPATRAALRVALAEQAHPVSERKGELIRDERPAAAPASKPPAIVHRANFATTCFQRSTPTDHRDAYRPVHGNGERQEDKSRLRNMLYEAVLNTGGKPVD